MSGAGRSAKWSEVIKGIWEIGSKAMRCGGVHTYLGFAFKNTDGNS